MVASQGVRVACEAVRSFVLFCCCCLHWACAATPDPGPRDELLAIAAQWSFADATSQPTQCAMAVTAAEWAELRARLAIPTQALPEPPCDFRESRLVVVCLRGKALTLPIAHTVSTEEGVDVVALTPGVAAGGEVRTVVHAFVVPCRTGQLAVVAQLPEAGQLVEQTLAVFSAR